MDGKTRTVVDPVTMASYLKRLGEVGATSEGGVTRRVYDESWVKATGMLERWMQAAGLNTRRDAAGNLFGRLDGSDPTAGVILTGSHVDTVVSGGRFDGALGILGGLAALAELRASGWTPRQSLEVVAICEEEGSRFAGNLLGSRAMLGMLDPSETDTLCDETGQSLRAAMRSVDLEADNLGDAARNDVCTFLELHVEQGPTLYEAGIDCGVVTTINGLTQRAFEVVGQSDHAGATPMDRRRDAMTAAAQMVTLINESVVGAGAPAVGTVGALRCQPGSANTIPEVVRFTLDLRHPVDQKRRELSARIEIECQRIAGKYGLHLAVSDLWDQPGSTMDAQLQGLLGDVASMGESSVCEIASGAAHDSQLWARHLPTAMLFVPSRDGRSHNPSEFTSPEDCAHGATVLMRALQILAS